MPIYDMNCQYSSLPTGIIEESRKLLESAFLKIEHCLGQLHENDAWWRPHESANAVGNIVLHLVGNIGQWLHAGVGQQPFKRNRKQEFAQRDPIPLDELRMRLHVAVDKADQVIANLHEEDLLRPTAIQGFDTNVLTALFHTVSHFEGHAQEITYISRLRLGDKYEFLFKVSDVQQNSE